MVEQVPVLAPHVVASPPVLNGRILGTLAGLFRIRDPAGSPAVRWTRLAKVAALATLVLGASFQLASFLAAPAFDGPLEQVRWTTENPDRANLAALFGILAMPFLFGTALVYTHLARDRSPRLAYTGGILLGFAFVGLTAVGALEVALSALAQDGRIPPEALADAAHNAMTPPMFAMMIFFLPCALFGLLAMGTALWRSGAVPRAATLLFPAFIVTDFFLQWGVIGHAIFLAAASWIGWAILAARAPPSASGTVA